MRLTKPQQQRFWREWSSVKTSFKAEGQTDAQIENERYAMLQRASFDSLTEVDPDTGFTAVLKELAALQSNLTGVLQADANKRRQKIWLIKHKGAPGYWRKIALDRFGTADLDTLKDAQIDQLLYTVSDCQTQQHFPNTQTHRSAVNRQRRAQAAANPTSRLPALPPPLDPSAQSDASDSRLAPVAEPEPDPANIPF